MRWEWDGVGWEVEEETNMFPGNPEVRAAATVPFGTVSPSLLWLLGKAFPEVVSDG